MKRAVYLFVFVFVLTSLIFAQGPRGKKFGFGINLGEPLGLTAKFWVSGQNAITGYIGGSYFGNPRIGADYTWHFDAFNSDVVKLYAGPGVHIGLGSGHTVIYEYNRDRFYYRTSGIGLAVRGIFGVDIIPRRTPLEFYLEMGPLIGLTPSFGSVFEGAVGFRFYP